MTEPDSSLPTLEDISEAERDLRARVVATPVVELTSDRLAPHLPEGSRAILKLELFQHTGSFKARGALLNVIRLDPQSRERGVTCVSAGNHAIALSWAAKEEGVGAKVVMPVTADPVRVAICRSLGAVVILMPDIGTAYAETERIVAEEGRTFVHPFEGKTTVLGTATVGAEIVRQVPDVEAVVVPVGGGGLIAGIARAVKLLRPQCAVYGVEPEGADALSRSLEAGSPQRIDRVATIADSLGAPLTLPYSFGLARDHVDAVVRVPDKALKAGMALLFDALKIAGEPACAAATAAAIGPLKEKLEGKRVGLIACGSNIGEAKFAALVAEGREVLAS
jgi:threonine dehydratase